MIKKLALVMLILPAWNISGVPIEESDPDLDRLTRSLEILAAKTSTPQKSMSERDPRCIFLEQRIHELINSERTKRGLAPLMVHERLAQAARNHSDNMARVNKCKHVLADGHNFLWRYHQVGFYDEIVIGNRRHLGAENIAFDTIAMVDIITTKDHRGRVVAVEKRLVPVPLDQVAHSVVEGWMNSTKGHRENILTPYWKHEGIGATITTDPETGLVLVYVTENFC